MDVRPTARRSQRLPYAYLLRWNRATKITLLAFITLLSLYTLNIHLKRPPVLDPAAINAAYDPSYTPPPPQHGNYSSKAIVAASILSENTTWICTHFPDFTPYIYVNDDATAPLTIPGQKGRESSTYLTYIIDHYDALPDFVIFIHGERYQWHNEDRMYDGVPVIASLRLAHVDRVGYANLRCTWDAGCPAEIAPQPKAKELWDPAWPWINMRKLYADVFRELFPQDKMPALVGVPCCAQFAATRKAIRSRSRQDYLRYRQWLADCEIVDPGTSGRAFEYLWHYIFTRRPVHCPEASQCFCDQYGLCDLPQCTRDRCKGRFWHAPFYTGIPKNWPEEGQGENGLPVDGWWDKELNAWW